MSYTTEMSISSTMRLTVSQNGQANAGILNTSSEYYEYGLDDPKGVNRIPAMVFLAVLIAVGTVGNMHVLWIYIKSYREQTRSKNMQNPYFVFVLSLALLDLFTCVFILPLDIVDNSTQFSIMPVILCKILRFFECYLHMCSVEHVVVISIHCCRNVCFPHGKQIERSLALKLCIGSYVFAILPSVPSAVMSGNHIKTVNGMRGYVCFVSETYNGTKWAKSFAIVVASLFAVCLIIICTSYILLIRFRWITRGNRKFATQSKRNRERKRAEKTTATLLILTIIFMVTYIPFFVIALIGAMDKDFRKNWNVATWATYRVFARFPHLNNVLNPFIYASKDPEFKEKLLRVHGSLRQRCPFHKLSSTVTDNVQQTTCL